LIDSRPVSGASIPHVNQAGEPTVPERLRDALGGLAALALGLAAFLILIGWQTLIPTNVEWLNYADRAMHTLGWWFYEKADWGMPPGRSPILGIELSNSIALVDGLPLFAIPFKLLRDWLPHPFQYWGDWLLLSFLLQSVFAYRIARELGAGRIVSLAGAAFALITPAFMFRINMHLALSGHWTILAALYLYIRRDPPHIWVWPLLIALTSAIHAYLLAMVLALWVAALIERLWTKRTTWGTALVELALGLIASLIVLWTAGFFSSGTTATYGYGMYKLNLLWPFLTYGGWSQLFPDLPHTKYDYEGLSFLGIGIFALLAVAIFSSAILTVRSAVAKRWLPLAVTLVLLALFAVSQKPALLGTELFELQLPQQLIDLASMFRSTGRFVWPLLYVITIGAVVLIGRRFRAVVAVPIVLVALGAQVADSGEQLLSFTRRLPAPSDVWSTELKSPFWDRAAAAGCNRVRAFPIVQGPGGDWRMLGYYALTHDMDIDAAYLGRTDGAALDALKAHEQEVLASGDFEPTTLYVLDEKSAELAAQHLAPDDLLAQIDKRYIFARHGAPLVDGLGVAPQLTFQN
jgi:hypothetical protein